MSDADLIKAEADAKRAEVESSWPKKWGGIIVPALATVCIAILSFAGTQLASINAETEKAIENNREALKLYFEHVATRPFCQEETAVQVSLIKAITNSSGLQVSLQKIIDCVSAKRAQEAPADAETAIAAGLPTTVETTNATTLRDFTAYIQYPAGKETVANALSADLEKLGLRVPGIQRVKYVPTVSDVRFYKESDRTAFQGQLTQVGDLKFSPTTLRQANLPDGIVEFWIAE